MLRRLVIPGVWLVTLPALAALPPHYQRQNELTAIIALATEEFGIGRPIEAIEMRGADVYEVRSGGCHMDVVIKDLPPTQGAEPMSGPRRFAVEAGPLVCDD